MAEQRLSLMTLVRQPDALAPLLLAAAALSLVLGHAAVFGVVHEADEGAAAHIWQLLIALELPALAFFAIRWLPRATKQALVLLGILAAILAANFAAVFFLT